MMKQKTFHHKGGQSERKWLHVDGEGKVVGRLASEIAKILRGKHRADFSPQADNGDFVIVTNCEKVRFTGAKLDKKKYYRHTGHIGGLKERTAKEQLERHPELVLMNAVKGMLPKTSLGRKQLTKLKVFVGPEHTHAAQNPQTLEV